MTEIPMSRCQGRSPAWDATTSDVKNGAGRRTARGALLATLAIVLGGLALAVPGVAMAQASLHEITWGHTAPNDIARFVVFVADSEGDQTGARQINVGKPANPLLQNGRYTYKAVISVDLDEYVAVAAVSLNGSVSTLSNWQAVPPSIPGQPFYIP